MRNIIKIDDSRKVFHVDYRVKQSEIATMVEYIETNYSEYIEKYRVSDLDLDTVAANMIQLIANDQELENDIFEVELRKELQSSMYQDLRSRTVLPIIKDLKGMNYNE